MSGGYYCNCGERTLPIRQRKWVVYQRQCNHSAFNGYKYTPSSWSSVGCLTCGNTWRTKAAYVDSLKSAGSVS